MSAYMGDLVDILCPSCGLVMELVRRLSEAAETQGLRNFTCARCGVSEWRADQPEDIEGSGKSGGD